MRKHAGRTTRTINSSIEVGNNLLPPAACDVYDAYRPATQVEAKSTLRCRGNSHARVRLVERRNRSCG